MKTPIIKVTNLSEEEINILHDTCKYKFSKNDLTQFYLKVLGSVLAIVGSSSNQVLNTEIECFSYNEFMERYKECSLEFIL